MSLNDVNMHIRPVTTLDLTVERLKEAIFIGQLPPGTRIKEAELCSRMSISRPTLREALRRLEAVHLIQFEPNRGTLVTTLDHDKVRQIHDVWSLLTGEVVAQFAGQSSPSDIKALNEEVDKFETAVANADVMGHITATNNFFGVILHGCGNEVLFEVLTVLVARINFLRACAMQRPERASECASELRGIIRGIKSRDAKKARAAVQKHIDKACDAALVMLDSQQIA